MKLSGCLYLALTLFLSSSVFAATCPPVKMLNQQMNKVRDKANNINWRADEVIGFQGNWDNFYHPTLRSCDGNKISGVEDCSFTLKN